MVGNSFNSKRYESGDQAFQSRNSVGHDAHVAEMKNTIIHEKIGRPRSQSIFKYTTEKTDGNIPMHPKLLAVDIAAYGLEWKESEKCVFVLFLLIFGISWNVLISFDVESSKLFRFNYLYWIKIVIQNCFFLLVFTICGFFVVTCNWKDSYSRKCCHVVMYLTPILIQLTWRSSSSENTLPSIWDMSWTVWFQFVPFLFLTKPLRRRNGLLMLSFRAIDRVQDRPYTLTWGLSQLLGSYVVIICLYMYLSARKGLPENAGKLILVPIIVNVFGDGLAEPVGVRFGYHKYKTVALWYNGKFCSGNFNRSYEGSTCVFIVTLLSLFPFKNCLSTEQFLALVVLLPPLMTLTEAFAPHTWDNPFMTLVGTVTIFMVYELI